MDAGTRALLQRYAFDRAVFDELRGRLMAGEAGPESNRIAGVIRAPAEDDVRVLPPVGSAERERLHTHGEALIAAGRVGIVVLAGGMATRFGGVVKATVPAVGERTFLDLKLRDVAGLSSRLGAPISAYLMTSFATHDQVERVVEERNAVTCFPQFVSLRMQPNGELFRDADGVVSPYAPGHGDLPSALREAGLLERFRAAGGELLFMSNVDNLGATLDPAVIAAHAESGVAVTAEVVAKLPGDRGGAPARVDGALQIVEAFRFPEGFDQDSIGVFNTNTFVLDAASLDADFPFTWFAVRKQVDGREAVQFERLIGQITAFLPSGFLQVERSGQDGRFQPVKDPAELMARREEIEALLRARGVL